MRQFYVLQPWRLGEHFVRAGSRGSLLHDVPRANLCERAHAGDSSTGRREAVCASGPTRNAPPGHAEAQSVRAGPRGRLLHACSRRRLCERAHAGHTGRVEPRVSTRALENPGGRGPPKCIGPLLKVYKQTSRFGPSGARDRIRRPKCDSSTYCNHGGLEGTLCERAHAGGPRDRARHLLQVQKVRHLPRDIRKRRF